MSEPTILTMGLGNVVVGHAVHGGMPCIVLVPVVEGKTPGTDATGVIPSDHLTDDAVCIRFSNMASVLAHLDRVKAMVEYYERATKAGRIEDTPAE